MAQRFLCVLALVLITGLGLTASASPKTLSSGGAGHWNTCVVRPSAGVKCWGYNSSGQLGDGTTTTRLTPVSVSGITTATAVTAAHTHACALLSGGSIKCWGSNYYGQVGDGTTTRRLTPVTVSGITSAVGVSTGGDASCAVLSDGTAKCWGSNYGQLGDGTTTNRLTPVAVSGITTATQISVGNYHTCAVLSDGTGKCWGFNQNGRLGDGTTTTRLTPVSVSGLANATMIGAGDHTCAVLSNGGAECWGYNGTGELGDGTTTQRTTPVSVSGITTATAIAAGLGHTCARLSDGSAKCWGSILGNGTTNTSLTPVSVLGITTASAIAAGDTYSCVILSDYTTKCWGDNIFGQLGDGTQTTRYAPVTVFGSPESISLAVVSGTVQQGQTLTSTTGSWSNSPASYTYQWRRCSSTGGSCVSISGATSSAYTLASGDVGYTVRAMVTATNSSGSASASSTQTSVVVTAAPVNTSAPAIAGSAFVTVELTVSNGSWTNSPTAYAYQWKRCDSVGGQCTVISGATASAYTVQSADLGATLRAYVTASNSFGATTAVTLPTAVVTAPPVNTQLPTIAGFGNESQNLTTSLGTWSNVPTSYSYSWELCSATGTNCSAISGATFQIYGTLSSDVGSMVRVQVTATNADGSATVASASMAILKSVDELILDYSPDFYFDKSEQWRPLNIERFLSESFPENENTSHHLVCKKEPEDQTTWCSELASSAALFNADNRTYNIADRAWINIRHDAGDGYASPRAGCVWTNDDDATVRECDNTQESKVYYAYGQDRAGYRYLNFWFFYRFNETRYASEGDHEGDWESVTVVLDPLDASSPRFERAIYEQHGQRNWFGVASPDIKHANVYPASGTHASYVDMCTEAIDEACPSPVLEAPLESDHGGQYAWSGNGCTSCFLPLEDYQWTGWLGMWGATWDADLIHTNSPNSINEHLSYTCLTDYFRPECNRPNDFRSSLRVAADVTAKRASRTPSIPVACRNWLGGGVVVLICDPAAAAKAVRTRGLPIRFRANVAAHQSLVAPGIAQVVGPLLKPSSTVRVRGRLPAKSRLVLTVWHKRKIYRAVATAGNYFRMKQSTITVSTRSGRLILRVRAGGRIRTLPAKVTVFGSAGG